MRRQSYDLNDDGLFDVEYADVLGVPFDFTARPVVVGPQQPRQTVQVKAVRPERDHLEIRFPRVSGYRTDPPKEALAAEFNADSYLLLTPELVGPATTRNEGIIGEGVDLNLVHTGDMRRSTLLYHLTQRLLYTKWRDSNKEPEAAPFRQLEADRQAVAGWLPGMQGRDLSGTAHVPGVGGQGLRDHHRRHHQQPCERLSRQGTA